MFSRWSTTTSLPSVRLIWLIRQHERSFVIRTQTVRIQRTIIANCELLILSPSLPHSPCRTLLYLSRLCVCLLVCLCAYLTDLRMFFFSLFFRFSISSLVFLSFSLSISLPPSLSSHIVLLLRLSPHLFVYFLLILVNPFIVFPSLLPYPIAFIKSCFPHYCLSRFKHFLSLSLKMYFLFVVKLFSRPFPLCLIIIFSLFFICF